MSAIAVITLFFVGAFAVIPFWYLLGFILHLLNADRKIYEIWTGCFEWKMLYAYVLIAMFALPAIGAFTIVNTALDNAFINR